LRERVAQMNESDARFISESLRSNCVAALIGNLRDHPN
jgi:hypothetical protein